MASGCDGEEYIFSVEQLSSWNAVRAVREDDQG